MHLWQMFPKREWRYFIKDGEPLGDEFIRLRVNLASSQTWTPSWWEWINTDGWTRFKLTLEELSATVGDKPFLIDFAADRIS